VIEVSRSTSPVGNPDPLSIADGALDVVLPANAVVVFE
jgi:hypothetical protein